jgi:hypothetical protein
MFFKGKFKLLSSIVSIVAVVSLTTGSAFAQQGPGDGNASGAGAGAEALTFDSGSANSAIIVRTDNIPKTTTSGVFVDLPGATASFVLAANANDLFVSNLSMETTDCSGTGTNFCEVRVVSVQGGVTTSANPIDPVTFDMESTDDESHSHEWSRRISNTTSAAQVINVKAQWRCFPTPCSFSADDFTFSVARYG